MPETVTAENFHCAVERPEHLTKMIAYSPTAAVWRSSVANLDFAIPADYLQINNRIRAPLARTPPKRSANLAMSDHLFRAELLRQVAWIR
jgi:hypothetical protein